MSTTADEDDSDGFGEHAFRTRLAELLAALTGSPEVVLKRAMPALAICFDSSTLPGLGSSADRNVKGKAQPIARVDRTQGGFQISLSAARLGMLRSCLEENRAVLVAVALDDVPEPGEPLTNAVLGLSERVATTFLVAHEACHVFCGHFDVYRTQRKVGVESFSESPSGYASGSVSKEERAETYYCLEHECDNTALQILMQICDLHSHTDIIAEALGESANLGEAQIYALESHTRIVVFRTLVMVAWLVLVHLEAHADPHKLSLSHPLGQARILSCLSELLQQFAELDGTDVAPDGSKSAVLDEDDAAAARSFLRDVLGPMLKAPWRFPALDADSLTALRIDVATEFGNLLQGLPVGTEAGRELRRVQARRLGIATKLARYRYFADAS